MKKITMWFGMLLFVVLANACSSAKEAEMETKDELADFRTWVNNTTANIADKTEEDWKRAKSDFKMRTDELDQMQSNFSEDVKEEYIQLKQQFNNADARYMESAQGEDDLMQWQSSLLGNYSDMSKINASNVREAYITFMENVRNNKGTWTNTDWEKAEQVLKMLNDRKDELNDVPNDADVKIKALQLEFKTLETAADVGDGN